MGGVKAEIAKLLKDLERQGWRIKRGRYWICYCPCEIGHLKTVHFSPSDPSYLRNLKGQLKRSTCWKEGER